MYCTGFFITGGAEGGRGGGEEEEGRGEGRRRGGARCLLQRILHRGWAKWGGVGRQEVGGRGGSDVEAARIVYDCTGFFVSRGTSDGKGMGGGGT